MSEALGHASLAQGQAEILRQRLNQMTGMAEKAALQVAKVNAKKKRKPNVRKVQTFVATANADGWDPSTWNGNIWDSDDYDTGPDEDVGPDEGSEIDPPSVQVKPIQRRRLVQRNFAPAS